MIIYLLLVIILINMKRMVILQRKQNINKEEQDQNLQREQQNIVIIRKIILVILVLRNIFQEILLVYPILIMQTINMMRKEIGQKEEKNIFLIGLLGKNKKQEMVLQNELLNIINQLKSLKTYQNGYQKIIFYAR